jgi:hypothetical protein
MDESSAGEQSIATCVNITQRIERSVDHASGTIEKNSDELTIEMSKKK